jgi:UDP-N-acetylglucosamine 2-epimerase
MSERHKSSNLVASPAAVRDRAKSSRFGPRIATIVGARPQFIKSVLVSRELRKVATEVVVHTGQHYDANMSEVFFEELNIPKADYNLGIGSGPHGEQTGNMLRRIETVLIKERPDAVLVYGDTNSTLAGALAAAKLHIPVAHVEAGLRSYNRRMPEEVNRIVTDHLSTLLFAPTSTAVKNLRREGIKKGVHLVGDVMYDAVLQHIQVAEAKSRILRCLAIRSKAYVLATVHRAENTDDAHVLRNIVEAFCKISLNEPLIWPVHPRTRKVLARLAMRIPGRTQLRLIEPVSYLEMLKLEKNARVILTDSGGVQKEAKWFQVPCVTLREETEWVETVEAGWNTVVGTDREAIVKAAAKASPPGGKAARKHGSKRGAVQSIVRLLLALGGTT